MKRSIGRILTTHVGSIVRPQSLRDLAAASNESPENHERYEQALAQAVAEIVKLQVKAGIDIVNDGEFGKSTWSNYILERITGFEHRPTSCVPCIGSDATATAFPK